VDRQAGRAICGADADTQPLTPPTHGPSVREPTKSQEGVGMVVKSHTTLGNTVVERDTQVRYRQNRKASA
jgi:hypothetical protein